MTPKMKTDSKAKPSEAAPKRVQRSRKKGWKMPPNTVYVGRAKGKAGKWGNPFKIGFGLANSLQWVLWRYRTHLFKSGLNKQFGELRGKNLACWCPLNQPCHADVLLKLANA